MRADATQMSLLNDSVLQQQKSNNEITTHREVYFRSGKIVAVNVNLFRGTKKSVKEASIKNLELKGSSLGIKSGTCSKIEKMLTTWLKSLYYNYEEDCRAIIKSKRLPVFITLTLSAKQQHTDTEIKRKILMPFIQELKRNWNVKYYFWKAEVQHNGNIHFHLIVDHYIDRKKLQLTWNQYQELLGYLSAFKLSHGHLSPPSTHIEIIDNVRKATSYVLKYVNKDVEGRNIEGRKWDCSKELKELKLQSYLEDFQITSYLNWLIANDKVTEYHDEFFSVYRFTERFDYDMDYMFVRGREIKDCLKVFSDLYVNDNERFEKVKKLPEEVKEVPKQLRLFEDQEFKKIDWTLRD